MPNFQTNRKQRPCPPWWLSPHVHTKSAPLIYTTVILVTDAKLVQSLPNSLICQQARDCSSFPAVNRCRLGVFAKGGQPANSTATDNGCCNPALWTFHIHSSPLHVCRARCHGDGQVKWQHRRIHGITYFYSYTNTSEPPAFG